jgi:hypothetical protein
VAFERFPFGKLFVGQCDFDHSKSGAT